MDSQTEYSRQPVRGTTVLALFFTVVLVGLANLHPTFEHAPQLLIFLGRFHPLIVHLPIGFLIALFVLEVFDLAVKSVRLHHATFIVAWLAAGSAVFAAVFGVMLSYTGTYGPELLQKHLWTGTATGVLSLWIVVLKMRCNWQAKSEFSPAYHGLVVVTTILLMMAGHYGGALTHGSDYLTQNMPGKLRMILGVAPAKHAPANPAAANPAELPVFATVIDPILQDKCVSCHGKEKQENKLRLDSFEALMAGGKSGSNVVARNAKASLMIQSLHLPKEDKKHMPPDGKPQLSADDVALLTWWIDQGASDQAKFAELKASRIVGRILRDRAGLPLAGGEEIALLKMEQILPVAQKVSAEIGLPVSSLSSKDAGLQISYIIGGTPFGDAEAAKIVPLKSNLVRLDLGGSKITDAGLVHIGQLVNLRRLDLSRTAVTDAGIREIARLRQLEYLNLYGTKITDASLEPLKQIESLRKIYLWQTAVTPPALAEFQKAFVDEGQLAAWKKEAAELQAKIDAMGVEANLGAAAGSTNAVPAATNAPPAAPAEKPKAAAAPAAAGAKVAAAGKPFNAKCCFTGKDLDPEFFSTYKGTVIGFCCGKCKARFDKDPAGEAAKIPPLAKL